MRLRLRVRPGAKAILTQLFLRTLARLSLDRVIPEKMSCREGVLDVMGERVDLRAFRRVVVVALGKAAWEMVEATAKIVAPIPLGGVIAAPDARARARPGFACFSGGHPYPNADSFRAGAAVVDLLKEVTSDDLVVYLLSGGGSALCEQPIVPEVTLDDHRELCRLLLTSGATILDVNTVRKHLSAIKGGRLAALAHPARQMTLYVSDAPAGHPSNVASGPTMPDESTAEDCYRIVGELGVAGRLPPSLRSIFDGRRLQETPKAGASCFRTGTWHCLLSPEDASETLADEARRLGWIVDTGVRVTDDCPFERASGDLFSGLERLRHDSPARPAAVVTGGEYSCPVTGNGVGGRNQAFVLGCVPVLAGRNIAVLSAGTDGIDGLSPAAGAVADGTTLARAAELGLDPADYARRSDSHTFFSTLGDALVTGPTGNNVRDLRILVAW